MNTASSTRSTLDGKLKAVLTEADLEAASLTGILDLVDSTVERRVEKVVERRGFRTVAGKIVKSAASQVRRAFIFLFLCPLSSLHSQPSAPCPFSIASNASVFLIEMFIDTAETLPLL
jgi:hypothetical protein